jgi:hypothetical protein
MFYNPFFTIRGSEFVTLLNIVFLAELASIAITFEKPWGIQAVRVCSRRKL